MKDQIKTTAHGTTYDGPSAVDVFRAKALARALKMFTVGDMQLTRGLTKTKALKFAGEYTGVKYKRGQFQQAYDDLTAVIAEREAELRA